MKIYWLQFRVPAYTNPYVGVTARDWADAIALSHEATGLDETQIEAWREIRDAAELDQNHVVPNMGVIVRRGVWYPNLPHIQ